MKTSVAELEPVGAEHLYVEPEPKIFTWNRSRKKISGAGAEEKWLGSATLVKTKKNKIPVQIIRN